jgi:hypothetical protein
MLTISESHRRNGSVQPQLHSSSMAGFAITTAPISAWLVYGSAFNSFLDHLPRSPRKLSRLWLYSGQKEETT